MTRGAVIRGWIVDGLVGGLGGGLLGAIVAVNLVIYTGIEGGYEASLSDVFRENVVVGIATVGILVGGPIVGIVFARRERRRRGAKSA